MRKRADLILETLPIDCSCQGYWFGHLIDVMPEKAFTKALKKLLRKRRLPEGSWSIAALYANRLNLNAELWLDRGSDYDRLLYTFGCQQFTG